MRKMQTLVRLTLLAFGLAAFVSCNKATTQGSDFEGEVSIRLAPSEAVIESELSRVNAEGQPELADFKVMVMNPTGDTLRRWDTATEMPEKLAFMGGSYSVVALYDGGTALPNFGTPHYYGENRFKIAVGETNKEVLVTPTLSVTKLKVLFDESFADQYQTYTVDVKTVGDQYVTFTKEEVRAAYLEPGSLKFRFNLNSKKDGKDYVYTSETIVVTKPQESHTITLKVNIVGGSAAITFTTDKSTNDIPIVLNNIPWSALPKVAPTVVPAGFELGGAIATYEGQSRPASVALRCAGGLKSFVITTEALDLAAKGWPAEVDILTASDEVKTALRDAGLVWDETKMKDESKETLYVDFSKVVAQLYTAAEVPAIRKFSIIATDKYNQVNPECQFSVVVSPPKFSLVAPAEGNVYARKAYFDMTYTNDIDKRPFMQYRKSDVEAWSTALADVVSEEEGKVRYQIKGLVPTTEYEFRGGVQGAGMTGNAGHMESTIYTLTTEVESQVPNAGMEDWDSYAVSNGTWPSHKIPYFDANAKGGDKWWATNNDRTTSYRAASFAYGYNSFPAVSMTRDKHAGNYAAEIRTTSASDIELNATGSDYEGNRTPGMLYSGTFQYNKPNDVITEGRGFSSRPSQVKFWYKFEAYSGESWIARVEVRNGSTVIGSGSVEGLDNVASYTEGVVNISYSELLLKATDIVVSFRSSNVNYPTLHPSVRKVTRDIVIPYKEDYGKNWGIFIGTVLKVDDISLVY